MRPVSHLPSRPGTLLLACAAGLWGCRATPPPEPAPAGAVAEERAAPAPEFAPERPAEPAPDPDPQATAQTALAAGDIAATRAALDALVTKPLLATCAEHLRAGRVEEALAAAEGALANSPELPAALFLAGVCRAELAERSGSEEESAEEFERALDLLERARGCAGALGTASAIARRLGQLDLALELARAGLAPEAGPCADIARVAELAGPRIEAPERALALAALEAWRERRESEPARAAAHFEEALDALQLAVSRAASDTWVWRTLGEAYLEAGRAAEARATLENGLDRLPADDELFELLARAARLEGGTREVVRVFARVQGKRPQLGGAWWYPGLEQFEAAVRGAADARRLLDEAERALRTCRAKSPSLAPRCLRYEALCRTARGWSWLEEGELQRAWNEFRGAGEHVDGGLQLEHAPLRSARDGLGVLIERHLARGELVDAVRAAERLAEDAPDDLRLVRQAADLSRDLGDRWHLQERDLKLAGKGSMYDALRLEELRVEIGTSRRGDDLRGTMRERDMFWQMGYNRERAARETYLRALAHYRRALELAPDDLRLGCDAAALVIRRLALGAGAREAAPQVKWAEDELQRLVEVGRLQVERGGLDEQARFAFDETWGDVHQLLGELYLQQRDEPRRARVWFERCLSISPVPRLDVSDDWLPRCLERERAQAEGRR